MNSDQPRSLRVSRRSFLQGAGASLSALPLLSTLTGCRGSGSPCSDPQETQLVLLGTMGGVSWWSGCNRASSSSALLVGDMIYLIDLGQGSTTRIHQAFNPGSYGSSTFLRKLRALLFTHLHMDHTADYPALLMIGPGAGLGNHPTDPQGPKVPLKVFGPCDRGQLPLNKCGFDESKLISTDSAHPSWITPTPGLKQMTEVLWQAYAQAINDMTLDNAYPDYRSLVEVKEIGSPLVERESPTCPEMNPFPVYSDELVAVTAILVDHHQAYPALAYRFETPSGSVVFSGDTGPDTRGNLQRLAQKADILVHEVIDRNWVDLRFGNPAEGTPAYALKQHMLNSHTAIDLVGDVAARCDVGTLVLSHIVPGNAPLSSLQQAQRGFSGQLIIGEDLMHISLGSPK